VLEISNEVNTKGYFPAYQARPEDCIFCALCCTMCPDVAITISEIEEEAAAKK
jgi:2-oxoglutarate ferredoxin oxidoreductase subunit delta